MSDLLKDLQGINDMAECLDNSSMSGVREWISTGSLALNAKLTGNLHRGIPSGRIYMYMGKSGTGKSFVAGTTAAEAQKMGYEVIWFTSEFTLEKEFLSNLGVDTSKAILVPVESLEQFKNQMTALLKVYQEKYVEKGSDKKIFIVLDSLGNLPSAKELQNAEDGHDAADMGLRAKIIKLTGRLLTGKLAYLHVPLILINHTYTGSSPNPKIPAPEIPQGGEGGIYISTGILQMRKRKLKEDKEDSKAISGNILRATSVKNRIVPEGQTAEIKVDFHEGVNKYFGLLEYAEKFGLIVKEGRKWHVKHLDKNFWESQLYSNPDIWEPILEEMNEGIMEMNKFSSVSDKILEEEEEKQRLLEESEESTETESESPTEET